MDNLPLDMERYRGFLRAYLHEAMLHSDGTVRGISEYLETVRLGGWFVRFRRERLRALEDARRACDEHRHWPLEVLLAHLGVEPLSKAEE